MNLKILDYVSVDAGKYKGRAGCIQGIYRNSHNGVLYATIQSPEKDYNFFAPQQASICFDVRLERLSPTIIDGHTRASDILS